MVASANSNIESILSFPSKSPSKRSLAVVINSNGGPVKLYDLTLSGRSSGEGGICLYSVGSIRELKSIRDLEIQSKIENYLSEKKDLIVINLNPNTPNFDEDGEIRLVADVLDDYLRSTGYLDAEVALAETAPLKGFSYQLDDDSLAICCRFLPQSFTDEETNENLFGWFLQSGK